MGWNDLEGLVKEAELDQGAEGQLWFVKVEKREKGESSSWQQHRNVQNSDRARQ